MLPNRLTGCAAQRQEQIRPRKAEPSVPRPTSFTFPLRKHSVVSNQEDEEVNAGIKERFGSRGAFNHRDGVTTDANPIFHQPRYYSVNAIRDYFNASSAVQAEPNSWLSYAEIPTSIEIMYTPPDNRVPRNITEGAWDSKEEYLSSHYELLREDAVFPLRVAVHQVC